AAQQSGFFPGFAQGSLGRDLARLNRSFGDDPTLGSFRCDQADSVFENRNGSCLESYRAVEGHGDYPPGNALQLYFSCSLNHELILEIRQGIVDWIHVLSRELLLPFAEVHYLGSDTLALPLRGSLTRPVFCASLLYFTRFSCRVNLFFIFHFRQSG